MGRNLGGQPAEQIALSSEFEQDDVDWRLKSGMRLPGWRTSSPLMGGLMGTCCSDHEDDDWQWITSSTALHKIIFGPGNTYISNHRVRKAIPKPKSMALHSFKKRVETFYDKNWPKQMDQNPTELARAGFFYTGLGDRCETFCCGLQVHQFNHYDLPWVEHKKHSAQCKLAKLVMGF